MRREWAWVAFLLLFAAEASAVQEQTLQLDGFTSGQTAVFQQGFVTGEIAAVRLSPTIPCPCQVTSISLLFGGSTGTESPDILVWEDPTGALDPGPPLFDGVVTLTGSNTSLQQVDISAQNVFVSGPFRVGIEFNHTGLPSVARDDDGSIDTANNFIQADFGGSFVWFHSADLGVTGDWILRATVVSLVSPPPPTPALPPWSLGAAGVALLGLARRALRRESGAA